jgi:hypothetical protein
MLPAMLCQVAVGDEAGDEALVGAVAAPPPHSPVEIGAERDGCCRWASGAKIVGQL